MKAGWQKKTLGEVCELINGRAYKKDELLEAGKYPVLRVGNFFTNDQWYHSDLELDADKYCDNGDLLYAWSASFGPRIWEGDKVIYHYHIWKVLPNTSLVTKEFLYRLLEWDVDQIKEAHGTGTTMMHVSKGSMESRVVPIPPLPEQQRIVTILDKAFEGIATATANAEKNLANARELFQSSLQSVFSNKGNSWVEKKLGTFTRINYGYTEKASFQPIGPRFLRITDIQENGVDWASVPFCRIESSDLTKYKLADGDIVFARTGATTGKSYLIQNPPEAVFASYLIKVQMLDSAILSPAFLYLFFQSNRYWDVINAGMTGSAQGGFNATKLGELLVPIPSSREQDAVVAKFDGLLAETKKLETIYQQKLVAMDELKKSILNQAFSGQLH